MIKPCPICQAQPTDFMEYEDCGYRTIDYKYEVRCSNGDCYLADGADFHFNSKDEATDAWNNMPRPFEQTIATLQKKVTTLSQQLAGSKPESQKNYWKFKAEQAEAELMSTANFLRGLTLDLDIPQHTKVAIHTRIHKLEAFEEVK